MKPDFIRIPDLHISQLDTPVGADDVRITVLGLGDSSRLVGIVATVKGENTLAKDVHALRNDYVDVYIVRKGPHAAALGMALIKEAFSHGLSEEDHEEYGEQVREIVGRRILTKVEPLPSTNHDPQFVFGLHGDVNTLVVYGHLPVEARNVMAYTSYANDEVCIFEKGFPQKLDRQYVHAAKNCNSAFFKRRTFGERSFLAERVREATPAQIRDYLTLKFEYENDKN